MPPDQPEKNVLIRSTPGAHARTHGPKLLNGAGPSGPMARTLTTPGNAAGYVGRQTASFPAEATTVQPLVCAPAIAAAISGASSSTWPPNDRFSTDPWWPRSGSA